MRYVVQGRSINCARDFREGPDISVDSPPPKAFYDLLPAYRDGNADDQQCAAGVALRFRYRMCIRYKGAIYRPV